MKRGLDWAFVGMGDHDEPLLSIVCGYNYRTPSSEKLQPVPANHHTFRYSTRLQADVLRSSCAKLGGAWGADTPLGLEYQANLLSLLVLGLAVTRIVCQKRTRMCHFQTQLSKIF